MTDLLYPRGADSPREQLILKFINLLRYEVIPGHRFAFIYASDEGLDGNFCDSRPHAKIPATYFLHIRRFLWRYYLFAKVHGKRKQLKLQKSFVAFLEKMLVMLDTALEQLVYPCSQLEDGQLEVDRRFPLFDLYLTTEFVVGYHDPKSVNRWREHLDNEAKDLERMDPFRFNWDVYDDALGDLLSGKAAQYDVDNVNRYMLEQLVTAVGQWYNIPTRHLTKAQCKAKVTNLVNGSSGLGELILDHNAPIIKGYDWRDEMSEMEWNEDMAKEAQKDQ